jgi:hypothetical protein
LTNQHTFSHPLSALRFPLSVFVSQAVAAGTESMCAGLGFAGEENTMGHGHALPAPALKRAIDFQAPIPAEHDLTAFDFLA